jgi:hypothetical protein
LTEIDYFRSWKQYDNQQLKQNEKKSLKAGIWHGQPALLRVARRPPIKNARLAEDAAQSGTWFWLVVVITCVYEGT